MELSVVIVNYNVKYFLEQCLLSVFKSGKGIEMEVFVVDNASADGSCQMVKQRFPKVKLIENSVNVGFSAANNQAIREASGQYTLLLNPDTIVEEDTFSKCIQFMKTNPNAGSLTVKMIDGKGRYLPESKRGLPTPMVSFFKIFGFAKLFPRSKVFARYYLGHLDENQINKIDILPGAFMFIRKDVLDKVGLLDESFFMYGEDIDLSYRIIKANYDNYYFPETRIIHYKGESTKKGSINYVVVFYKAMILFAQKHFTQKKVRLFMAAILFAIYLRALLSICRRLAKRVYLPVVDTMLIAIGFLFIVPTWESYRFHSLNSFPAKLVMVMIPAYTAIWLLSNWLNGAYDKPQKLAASTKGILWGTILILSVYALLPQDYRFSRAIILLGAAWTMLAILGIRLLSGILDKNLIPSLKKKKRLAIVGKTKEAERVIEILNKSYVDYQYIGLISPHSTLLEENQLASIDKLEEFVRINDINEIIFCGSDISSQDIIKNMLILSGCGVEYKISPPETISIIGSNSISTSIELYIPPFNAINSQVSRRNKRLLDIGISLAILLFAPVWFFVNKKPSFLFLNAVSALLGKKTWIGYLGSDKSLAGLPKIKKGVFPLKGSLNDVSNHEADINLAYARNYSVVSDLSILCSNLIDR